MVLGRRPLPARAQPWELTLRNEEGAVCVYEPAQTTDEAERRELLESMTEIAGWVPHEIVFVRKAWELAQVVAEELATALEGAVFCDVDNEIFFDAAGSVSPVDSIEALGTRLEAAFDDPQPFFDRWHRAEVDRYENEMRESPSTREANDWSDVQ